MRGASDVHTPASIRLGARSEGWNAAAGLPTVPPGRFEGVLAHLGGRRRTPNRSGAGGRAVAAHLLWKLPDVDRFLEIADETGREQPSPIAEVGARAPRDDR
jgi:hypothetical protein